MHWLTLRASIERRLPRAVKTRLVGCIADLGGVISEKRDVRVRTKKSLECESNTRLRDMTLDNLLQSHTLAKLSYREMR